jgi:CIC family chloride channel protein
MGTLFAGIIRAPMTSVLMIFEITQDYQILVPLMLANMLSFLISRHYQHEPVYHALLGQDGIHLRPPDPRRAEDERGDDIVR